MADEPREAEEAGLRQLRARRATDDDLKKLGSDRRLKSSGLELPPDTIDSGCQVWKLAQLIPASKRRQAEKVVAESYPIVELPWDPEEHEHSWLNVTERMDIRIRLELVGLWEELRAIDIVVAEVAEEFDGEDPLRPIMRGIVETTRKKLIDLHKVLSSRDPIELKEPGEEALDLARTYFENGKRLMNSL